MIKEKMAHNGTHYSCHGTLTQKMAAYLNSPELSDITIKVGEWSFPAHRLVLGARSDELARMMKKTPGNVLEMSEFATQRDLEVFELVLRFLYTGEMTFSDDDVKTVISLANRLSLGALSQMAQEWVGDTIDRGDMVSAVTWLRDAVDFNLPSLRDRCLRTLALYFEYIPEASWLGLCADELLGILDQSNVVADDEETVIKRVDNWLAAKGSYKDNDDLRDLYSKISSKIRFPFIETSKIIGLRETSLIVKYAAASNPQVLMEAVTYRSLSAELTPRGRDSKCLQDCSNAGCLLLKGVSMVPRLYLDFSVPGEIATDNIHRKSSEGRNPFRKVDFDSYKSAVKCILRETNGCWTNAHRVFDLECKLKQHEAGRAKAWSIEYNLNPEYQHQSMRASYRVVTVARPLDKDSEFFLPDNPVVTIADGSLSCSPGSPRETVTLRTQPVFAGRKPQRIEIAAIAYILKNNKS